MTFQYRQDYVETVLEWVLDQYKERKPRDPTILEKFNNYRFSDHKEGVVALLCRVCTVSAATMEIVDSMAYWERREPVVHSDRDKNYHPGNREIAVSLE